MKRILAALSMAAMTAAPFSASAAPAANTLTYSGYLAQPGGAPETANVSVTFALYDVATNGAPLWSESDSITPGADGWFSTTLGDGTAFPAALDFSQQLYLGIKVGAELEMAPRIKVANAPRALSAEWTALNGIPAPCSGATPVLQGFTAAGNAVCAASAAPTWAALTGFPAACSGATPVLTGFAPNGSALCAADAVGLGTLTGLTVGSGLTGGGTSGSVAVGLTTCTPGQILKYNAGAWGCAADDTGTSNPGTVTTVSAAPATVFTVANPTSTPAVTMNQASGTASGYLSSADWTAFSGKLDNGTGTVSGANILDGTITGADLADANIPWSKLVGCTSYGLVLKYEVGGWGCYPDANTVTGLGTSGNLTLDAAGILDTSANPSFSTVTATNFYGIADAAYLAYSTSTGSVVPSSLSTAATPSAGQVPSNSGAGNFNWITPVTSVGATASGGLAATGTPTAPSLGLKSCATGQALEAGVTAGTWDCATPRVGPTAGGNGNFATIGVTATCIGNYLAGQTMTVNGSQTVFVTASSSMYTSTAGAVLDIFAGVCYRPTGGGTIVEAGRQVIRATSGSSTTGMVPVTVSGLFTPPAGTYDFGLCAAKICVGTPADFSVYSLMVTAFAFRQ